MQQKRSSVACNVPCILNSLTLVKKLKRKTLSFLWVKTEIAKAA